jgi:arylsulfatase A-like enzyme
MASIPASAQQAQKPNILVIMGDDVGWFNIGAYHRGMMSGKTPNLDKLASDGMMFTDYYAEASCTAGRANFITGELPIRTGLTTVGQAGADVGIPDQAVTLATVLKSLGYATGQFGKNHLGDLNKYLPTVHGFDEFFGYLYHLDAMSDPYWYSFPANQDYYNKGDLILLNRTREHGRLNSRICLHYDASDSCNVCACRQTGWLGLRGGGRTL